ncbi:sugar ABC transporter substrate-binding protein [Mogibacterium timidum]|uniref:sugar ABC transporter substrate-binding protein n=1 Tax=Mogibacterium timidum TaxID=35519 RepID=UPI0028D73BA9|nr:sugar ABC transporter substrate-binding protein [Mogibacterium timidum]
MKLKIFLSTVLAATMLAGCSSGTSTASTLATENAEDKNKEQVFIGLAMHNQTETWAVQFAESFKAAAEADGAKVAVTDANATPANQVSQIEDLVAQGIDVLVVLPADYTALGNALKEAKDKGIKIVNADSKVTEEDQDKIDCFVTADAYKGGYTAGQYLAKVLPENAVFGGLNYSQLSVIADRFIGMQAAFNDAGRTDIKVVEKDCTDLSAIATYTEDILMSNPDITGFLCLNDNTALTCYGTCKQMNYSDAIVIGFDGSPAGKQSIAAGEMTGTMVYSPVDLAKASEEAAIKLAKGENVEKETTIDMYMINKDNIGQYDLDAWN